MPYVRWCEDQGSRKTIRNEYGNEMTINKKLTEKLDEGSVLTGLTWPALKRPAKMTNAKVFMPNPKSYNSHHPSLSHYRMTKTLRTIVRPFPDLLRFRQKIS